MGIIMSAASVYVPDSEDLRPDISFSTVFQHHKLDNYGTVRVPTLFSELVQRTLLLGSSHPPLRLSPLLQSGCKADGSRLNQHEVCLSCRGLPLSGFGLKHEQAGYTLLIVQFRPRSDG